MKTNVKVLFFAPSAYLLGGVQTWLDYSLDGLSRTGFEIVLVLTKGRYHDPKKYLEVHDYSRVLVVDLGSGTQMSRVIAIEKVIKSERPNIVVNVNLADLYVALRRLKNKGNSHVKFVTTLHGFGKDYLSDIENNADILDGVVCTNKLTCQLVSSIDGFPRTIIFYVPYGVNFQKDRIRKTAFGDMDTQKWRVLWMGRLSQDQKRVLDLPEIWSGVCRVFDNCELIVAGDGPDRIKLEDKFKETGCTKWKSVGFVDHETLVNEMLGQYRVLVVTSEWETGPIVVWEAMANGLAVVTSRYIGSGLEGALKDQKNALLFDIGDTSAATQCLLRLFAHQELFEGLTTNGYKLVADRYSIRRSIDTLATALRSVASREGRNRSIHLNASGYKPLHGRLDKLFSPEIAERIRRIAGRRFEHTSAGSEWPHSLNYEPDAESEHLQHAGKMDRLPRK